MTLNIRTMTAKEAQKNLRPLLDLAETGNEAVIIIRRSRQAAAVVPISWLQELLEHRSTRRLGNQP